MLVLPSCSKVIRQLRTVKGTRQKTKVLSDNAGPFLAIGDIDSGKVLPMEDKITLWHDLKSSGLLEELCSFVENGIPFDNAETSTFTDEVAHVEFSLHYIRLLITGCREVFNQDDEAMLLLCRKLATLYRGMFTEVKPETLKDPLISVMVYFEPLLLFSCLCEEAAHTQNFSFVELFPSQEIMDFVLALYFEPECRLMRIPRNYVRETSKHYTAWMKSYWADVTRSLNFGVLEVSCMIHCCRITTAVSDYCFGNDSSPLVRSVSLAFSKYGYIPIGARCCDLFKNPLYRHWRPFQAALSLVMLLFRADHPDIGGLVITIQENGIHEDVAKACWIQVEREPNTWRPWTYRDGSLIAKQAVEMLSLLFRVVMNPAIFNVANLQYHQDQIFLMGRSLITSDRPRFRDDEGFLLQAANHLQQFYSGLEVALKSVLYETCMQVARSLREAVRCETKLSEDERTTIVQIWEKVTSTIVGIDVADFPALEMDYHQRRGMPTKGCNWIKCPRYRVDMVTRRGMLLCTVCKKVEYCGPQCQRKDWKAGGHRATCNGSRS